MIPNEFYNYKERITGIISFIGAIGWGLGILVQINFDELARNTEGLLMFMSLIIPLISTLLYIFWTDFGKKEKTELEKIEYENELLKKKLEQKSLKDELK